MQAVILVGGKGTRLLPLTCNTPKPMVPVLNRPFMEYVIRHLGKHNVKEVVMAMNYLPQAIESYFGDGASFGSHILYYVEDSPRDTAGAVKNCEPCIGSEAFFVLNGDIFTDLDLTDMLRFHKSRRAKLTIALTPVEDPTAYGLVETDSSGRITRFLEKPKREEVTTNMINAGTYILEREVLDFMPKDAPYSFERKLFPMLLERGEPVYAYPSAAYWIDIGRPEKYFQLHKDLLKGKKGQLVIGEASTVHPSASTKGVAVIGPSCSIGDNAIIEDSIIWENNQIESGVTLRDSFLACGCRISSGSSLEGAIVGDNVIIGQGLKFGAGSKLWPGTIVEPPK